MAYNETEDLRRNVQDAGQVFSPDELHSFLEEGSMELEINIGRNYTEDYHNPDREVILRFKNLLNLNKIYILPNTEIPEAEYSEENGVITFDETYYEDEIEEETIKVFYEPKIFKLLELLYATRTVLEKLLQQTGDEIVSTQYETVDSKIDRLEQRLNQSTTSIKTTKSGLPVRRRWQRR